MGFSRQEYWSGLPFPSPGELLDPGIEPGSPALQTDSLPSEPLGEPIEATRKANYSNQEKKTKQNTEKRTIKNHFLPINYFHWSADFHSVCHCRPSETAS